MIAVDTNILVGAHRRDLPSHAQAALLLRSLAESPQPWAIPWPCIHEFLVVVTRPRYFEQPSTMQQAKRQVDAWLASPSLRLLQETPRHWQSLCSVLEASGVLGTSVHDAKIAAICLDSGVVELLTADADFVKPTSLRIRDPFV